VGFQADDRFIFHKRADSLTTDKHGCTRIFIDEAALY
jgi:hypothetical protein